MAYTLQDCAPHLKQVCFVPTPMYCTGPWVRMLKLHIIICMLMSSITIIAITAITANTAIIIIIIVVTYTHLP